MEIKKSESVDIEKARLPIFLVALVCVCSVFYVALQWHVAVAEPDIDKILEQMEQDLDLQEMKEKTEMVAAISEDVPHEIATTTEQVQPEEMVQQLQDVPPVETTTSDVIIKEEEPEVEDAKIKEVPLQQVQEDSKLAEETHFRTVDVLPEFPGGHSAFIAWIDKNLKYPENSRRNRKEGKVVISFVIGESGEVQDLKLVQKCDYDIEMAVMRLFIQMPKWKPGMKDGKPAPTMIAVPINFEI